MSRHFLLLEFYGNGGALWAEFQRRLLIYVQLYVLHTIYDFFSFSDKNYNIYTCCGQSDKELEVDGVE